MAVDLNPWVEYEFRVVATNLIGTGDPSIPSRMIRTNEAGKIHGMKLLFIHLSSLRKQVELVMIAP